MHLAVQALSSQHIQHGSVQLRGSYRHLFVLQGGATSRCLPPTSASDQIGLGLQLVSSAPMAKLKQFSIVPPFYSTLKIILLFNCLPWQDTCPRDTVADVYISTEGKIWMVYLLAEIINSCLQDYITFKNVLDYIVYVLLTWQLSPDLKKYSKNQMVNKLVREEMTFS